MVGIVASRAAKGATAENVDCLKKLPVEAEAWVAEEEFDWKTFMDVDRWMHIALAHVAQGARGRIN